LISAARRLIIVTSLSIEIRNWFKLDQEDLFEAPRFGFLSLSALFRRANPAIGLRLRNLLIELLP